MDELVFESSLTEEEVEENFEDFSLVESLEESLLEVLAYKTAQREAKKKKGHGTIGLTPEKNLYVDYGDFHVEMWGLDPMTELSGLADWDESGYFAIETNYGQEFYEVEEYLKDLFTKESIEEIGFMKALSQMEGFVVKPAVSEHQPLKMEEEPWKVIDNIAIFKGSNGHLLHAIDLLDPTHRLVFVRPNKRYWYMLSSTFPDGKRKYQALYYCKCVED